MANWQQGNSNQIAFSRGNKAFIAFNRESSSYWKVTLYTGMPAGVYCNIIGDINADNTSTCSSITVDSSGKAYVEVPPIKAVAIHLNAKKN